MATIADETHLLEEISDFVLDFFEVLLACVSSPTFWAMTIALIYLRRFQLLPRLQRMSRIQFTTRMRRRRRILRDTLKDPFLLKNLKYQAMRWARGDAKRAAEMMEQLRLRSEATVDDNHDPKGEDRIDAVSRLLSVTCWGTAFAVWLVCFSDCFALVHERTVIPDRGLEYLSSTINVAAILVINIFDSLWMCSKLPRSRMATEQKITIQMDLEQAFMS
mmetsp:Transcript_3961/g.10475  ORF Transcript_3961/g.10475 Transcript_3961/m.10475 type:complete len:219 (-) Transcript_3961:482-1138(-)